MCRPLALLLLLAGAVRAQVYDQGGPLLSYTPAYEAPQMHKWYGLRSLPETYARPWYYTDTDYARQYYTRYINRQLEGREFFDTFGRSLGLGWQVYTWTQEQPGARGSIIDKKRRFKCVQRLFWQSGDRRRKRTSGRLGADGGR
jgi:hypothetical protein